MSGKIVGAFILAIPLVGLVGAALCFYSPEVAAHWVEALVLYVAVIFTAFCVLLGIITWETDHRL